MVSEDAFDQAVKIIAEVSKKKSWVQKQKEKREKGSMKRFCQKNISHQLKAASLWFQFHVAFDERKDFSSLEKLSYSERLRTFVFWRDSLFRNLDLYQNKDDFLKKNKLSGKRLSEGKK